jgi:hypothetical protein
MNNAGDVALITEVELTADDLQGLSPTPVAAPASAKESPQRSTHPSTSATNRAFAQTVAGVVGVALIAIVAVNAQLEQRSDATSQATSAWTPISTRPSASAEPELAPTLFTNPFDESEVFELAPGLSHEEARQIVADILLERARSRGIH